MTTLRYSFRPSLFERERTIVLDDQGVASEYGGTSFRTPWSKIAEVHIEPVPAGDDGKSRWLVNLRTNGGAVIKIDSVNVLGTADFEHKTEEFIAVLKAIHAALAMRRPPARFRYGTRTGIIIAWRIALLLVLVAGIFGIVAAIATEEYEAILYAGPFVAFGLVGLMSLRGKRGPKPYDPTGFVDNLSKP